MAATEQYAERTWTYVGRRQLRNGGLGYLWLNQTGEEALFKKVRGSVIGATYTVTASADESLVKGTPIFQSGDRHPDSEQWDLEDRTAYTSDQARLVEARAAKEVPFEDLTLRELRAQLAAAPATRRTAMLAVILRKLGA
jgi:hypothetical protein